MSIRLGGAEVHRLRVCKAAQVGGKDIGGARS